MTGPTYQILNELLLGIHAVGVGLLDVGLRRKHDLLESML